MWSVRSEAYMGMVTFEIHTTLEMHITLYNPFMYSILFGVQLLHEVVMKDRPQLKGKEVCRS